jgi:hypothetical protein
MRHSFFDNRKHSDAAFVYSSDLFYKSAGHKKINIKGPEKIKTVLSAIRRSPLHETLIYVSKFYLY